MFSTTTILTKTFAAAKKGLGALLLLAATAGIATAGGSYGGGGKVPELDPGSLASAATLLTGGFLMLTDRIRRRK